MPFFLKLRYFFYKVPYIDKFGHFWYILCVKSKSKTHGIYIVRVGGTII